MIYDQSVTGMDVDTMLLLLLLLIIPSLFFLSVFQTIRWSHA